MIKKKVVDLKNELVRVRVTYDMGEYQNFLVGKTPSKGKKNVGDDDYKLGMEKVKQYVEDLTVLRENLLKIEFRNIELEELQLKKEREIDDLKNHIKDLNNQLRKTINNGSDKSESYLEPTDHSK